MDKSSLSLYDQWFTGRESYLENIQVLEGKHNLRLLPTLSGENNISQFKSNITEINFGIFFNDICSSLIKEKPLDGKRPDWTVIMNDQEVIIEVLRLNPTEKDRKELDFQNEFINEIGKINIGCYLYFDYDDRIFNPDVIYIIHCREAVENWLSVQHLEGECILLQNTITIKFMGYRPVIGHVCLSGGGGTIQFDYRRLQFALRKKMTAYSELIAKKKLPYIICLYMDFHSWFQESDVYRELYGLSTEHHEFGDIFYSHSIERGIYYDDERTMKHVSGIITCQSGRYTYFNNFIRNNLLSKENTNCLLKLQHPYE